MFLDKIKLSRYGKLRRDRPCASSNFTDEPVADMSPDWTWISGIDVLNAIAASNFSNIFVEFQLTQYILVGICDISSLRARS